MSTNLPASTEERELPRPTNAALRNFGSDLQTFGAPSPQGISVLLNDEAEEHANVDLLVGNPCLLRQLSH